MTQERFEFRSEAKELLQLMAHSLYSSKDVFLRELISNASDALDKRRFEALTQPELLSEGTTLEIRIHSDKTQHRLVIEDNGIGMTREDLIENLGTIAHSGTKAFVQRMKDNPAQEASALIGQFGVGFYSAFIVAESVKVTTRRVGQNEAHCFESTGDGVFTIAPAERAEAGTTIELSLRPEDLEDNLSNFTDEYVLRQIIKKYSDFVQYPILLQIEREVEDKDDEEKDKEDAPKETTLSWEQINSMKAIWLKSASEVSDEEYKAFYQQISFDWEEPLQRIALKAEGTSEYRGLIFIPARAPYDMNYRDAKYGLKLYAQHVLIMEQCAELLPDYLRFIKGVIDSADLNLNISREILQKDRNIAIIRKHLTKKTLDAIENLADNDKAKYATFWENYDRLLKEGAANDYENRTRLMNLLRFASTYSLKEAKDEDKKDEPMANLTDLKAYIARMHSEQKDIYVIAGESLEMVKNSPHLEAFTQKGYEVIFLVEAYDEILFTQVPEFEGKKFVFIGRGEVELGDEEEKKAQREKLESQSKDFAKLIENFQNSLSNEVESVRLSARLTQSPAVLVGQEGDVSPHLHRILSKMGASGMPNRKRVLELNPNHPLLLKLHDRLKAQADDALIPKFAQLLYNQALLAEGSPLPDPIEYGKLITDLMVSAL